MSATLYSADKLTVTLRVLTVTTEAEQQQHIDAYRQHGYQHKNTRPLGNKWLMSFVKSEVLLSTGRGDTVPL